MVRKATAADANSVYECHTIKSAGCPEGVGGLQVVLLCQDQFSVFCLTEMIFLVLMLNNNAFLRTQEYPAADHRNTVFLWCRMGVPGNA